MDPFITMLLLTTASGACILAGGLLARVERIRPLWLEQELRHTVIAFGGGILMAAIAFVLVPEGRAYFDASLWGVALLMLGGVVFMQIDRILWRDLRSVKVADKSQQCKEVYVPDHQCFCATANSGTRWMAFFLFGRQIRQSRFQFYSRLIRGLIVAVSCVLPVQSKRDFRESDL
jgi:ZIP family zinc transporter